MQYTSILLFIWSILLLTAEATNKLFGYRNKDFNILYFGIIYFRTAMHSMGS